MEISRIVLFGLALATIAGIACAADMSRGANNFYTSDKVDVEDVRFKNQYGMEIVGTLFTPKDMKQGEKYAALVVGHPFAAVRQQSANLYATKMAEAGFVALTFDQSFWGESAGTPRGAVLPDVYTENISAGVDFVGTRPFVDPERIGVIGICASGGFSIAATKIDPRIKALATVSMYDMGENFRSGLNKTRTVEDRNNALKAAAAQRFIEFETGEPSYNHGSGGSASPEAKESFGFYETERGKVPSNDRLATVTSSPKFMNFYPFADMGTISPRPILFVVGEIAPSRHFTEEAFKLASEPKELVVIKGTNRVDLYDRTEIIPWTKLTDFFKQHLTNQ